MYYYLSCDSGKILFNNVIVFSFVSHLGLFELERMITVMHII